MNVGKSIGLAIFVALVVIAGSWVARHFFSADARIARRRRRSNTRVASTANRPMVKFSVRNKKNRCK